MDFTEYMTLARESRELARASRPHFVAWPHSALALAGKGDVVAELVERAIQAQEDER